MPRSCTTAVINPFITRPEHTQFMLLVAVAIIMVNALLMVFGPDAILAGAIPSFVPLERPHWTIDPDRPFRDQDPLDQNARSGAGAARGFEALAHHAQQHVAHVVAEGVVDGLEAVEVEDEQAALTDGRVGGGHVAEEHRPVRQAGEVVGVGHALELALALAA